MSFAAMHVLMCQCMKCTQHHHVMLHSKSTVSVLDLCAGSMPENEYVFASLALPENGSCSVLSSTNDALVNNSAALTGGGIYSTDLLSLSVTCASGEPMDTMSGCASWTDNSVYQIAAGPGRRVAG